MYANLCYFYATRRHSYAMCVFGWWCMFHRYFGIHARHTIDVRVNIYGEYNSWVWKWYTKYVKGIQHVNVVEIIIKKNTVRLLIKSRYISTVKLARKCESNLVALLSYFYHLQRWSSTENSNWKRFFCYAIIIRAWLTPVNGGETNFERCKIASVWQFH